MKTNPKNEMLSDWLTLTQIQASITSELERELQDKYNLSLNEFYVLYFLSQTNEKKLRLQKLQDMIGLSQSAVSRMVGRLEANNCKALQRHVCEADRRGIYTSLTEVGEENFHKALGTVNEILQASFTNGTTQKELQTLLQKMSANDEQQ
ncbi:MarR family transcriptional regulator [Brevibacillus reuszeri]|uniref:MarR family winged helix-turn-helix transcriptional regulator n=1 Tax=Brevibacillus reuszeri TaxID=54915 RepID=UPI001B2BE0FC|nr:MarR family transcriptional regulator [Brevibacillus reuszeri]GIO08561.1 MarR family transcriptional regulator [Brevibacillus reuszeri]